MKKSNKQRPPDGNTIVEVLPRLRRFGYMLTRSKERSDTVIATVLHRIADDPSLLSAKIGLVSQLFQMFLQELAQSDDTPLSWPASGLGIDADEWLADLSFHERQVFLLRYVEEFGRERAAEIMMVSEIDVRTAESVVAHHVIAKRVVN